MPSKGKNCTLLAAGSASGKILPPFFIFPGDRLRDQLNGGQQYCPEASGGMTENGWITRDLFTVWLKQHFYKHLSTKPTADKPVLLLYDGHLSHIDIGTMDWAADNHIIVHCLLAHTSHICQPLDISCFSPLETAFDREKRALFRKEQVINVVTEQFRLFSLNFLVILSRLIAYFQTNIAPLAA